MNGKKIPKIGWLDPLKAFALLGVMLNHLVEGLDPSPWFTQPSGIWDGFLTRVPIFVSQDPLWLSLVKTMAWVGDYGPSVFIFASGFGLSWAALHSEQGSFDWKAFLKRRILKLFPLYILLHLIYLVVILLSGDEQVIFANPNFLLSMLGLRATDALFFYINPSWWFVWLILQLYLVFPLLYRLLLKLGPVKTFLAASLFTILSRLSGLLGFRYSESEYFWLLGIFFGTRLAEFCIGMTLAAILKAKGHVTIQHLLAPKYIFLSSFFILSLGLAATFIRYSVLIDHFLETLGLVGLFYSIWKMIFEKNNRLSRIIMLLGTESYGIYLVHQLLLIEGLPIFSSDWRLIGAVSIILVSFPAGIYLTKLSNWILQKILESKGRENNNGLRILVWILSLGALITVWQLGMHEPGTLLYRFLALLVLSGLVFLVIWEVVCAVKQEPLNVW